MAALIKDRKTDRRPGVLNNDPVAASTVVFAGAIVMLNAAGDAVPGATAVGLKSRGMAVEYVDNSTGVAGDKRVNTEKGVFRFANDGSINRTHITGVAYVVDDQTVAATDGTGTRSAGGKIVDVDADGVWVDLG